MKFQKGKIENGKVVITDVKEINQSELTSDCWMIQMQGLAACKECEFLNTDECGSKDILKKLSQREN